MSDTSTAATRRWEEAQDAESRYWGRVSGNGGEFLRILHEKQTCFDLVRNHVPEAFGADPDHRKYVVEIGVGSLGIGVCSLLDPPGAWRMIGVDPQPKRECTLPNPLLAVYRAIKEIPLHYVQAMGENVGLPSNTFDVAISYNVIDHTPNWRGILNEICRILRPGGYFVLSVDTLCLLNKLRWALWQRWAWEDDPYIVAHPFRFTAFKVERILPEHGFEIVWMERSRGEMRKRILGKARRLTVVGLKPPAPNEHEPNGD